MIKYVLVFLIVFNVYAAEPPKSIINCSSGYKRTCEIYFKDSIETPQAYADIIKSKLTPKDTVVLHLAGNGGEGSGLVYIINALKESKAHVVGSMEGSIASAHVFLLTASDEIQIKGEGYLLFHSISTLNMVEDICTQQMGKDRGIAVYTKCTENNTKILEIYNKILDKYAEKYLTKEEMGKYLSGHDVILSSDEFKLRINNGQSRN